MPDGIVANHLTDKSHPSRAPAPHAGIPSIEALARHRLTCRSAHTELERTRRQDAAKGVAREVGGDAERLLDDRDIYLRDLITTLQARTLGDALVQIAVVQELLDPHVDLRG